MTCPDCPDIGKSKRKTCCRRAGGQFQIGQTVPIEPRKLDIRPAFTGAGSPSFKPSRHNRKLGK